MPATPTFVPARPRAGAPGRGVNAGLPLLTLLILILILIPIL